MKPTTDTFDSQDVWNLIDDVGYTHHVIIWMIILELEGEGVYPINTSSVRRRMFQWWGEYQKKDRVHGSMGRLLEYGLLEREEVTEWPYGYHWTTTPDGREIAHVIAETWAYVLDTAGSEEGDR